MIKTNVKAVNNSGRNKRVNRTWPLIKKDVRATNTINSGVGGGGGGDEGPCSHRLQETPIGKTNSIWHTAPPCRDLWTYQWWWRRLCVIPFSPQLHDLPAPWCLLPPAHAVSLLVSSMEDYYHLDGLLNDFLLGQAHLGLWRSHLGLFKDTPTRLICQLTSSVASEGLFVFGR